MSLRNLILGTLALGWFSVCVPCALAQNLRIQQIEPLVSPESKQDDSSSTQQPVIVAPPSVPTQATQPVLLPGSQVMPPPGPSGQTGPSVEGPPPAAGDRDLSDIERVMSGKASEDLTFDIKQFGYDLFLSPLGPSPAGGTLPVGPEYILVPGDGVRLSVWGSIEGTWDVTIDRDGNITLPKVGAMGVAGLSFRELKDALHKELSKHYTDFEMNVSMGNLQSIRIYVVGKAKKAGAYNVSSLSTMLSALCEIGGPSKVGSMRDIQLKRNGDVIAHLDVYDFLLTGQRKKDPRLLPDDVLFIPGIGPAVGIAGNVKSPAIYELKGRTRVSDLIRMAGGVSARAYLQRVQVERYSNIGSKIILDLNLKSLKGKEDIGLEDGDMVKVFPATPTVTNRVRLSGNVWRPGEYEWRPGMRVTDLLRSTEDLKPEALMDYARIDRLIPPDFHLEYRTFNLGKVLLFHDEAENIALQPYDQVVVFNKWEVKPKEKVRSEGALAQPGEFDYRPNMRASDLIKLSGGLRHFAVEDRAEITRVIPSPQGPQTSKIAFNPTLALQGDPEQDIVLREDDYLFIRTVPEWDLYKIVTIAGEVKYPGKYTFSKGDKLSKVLEAAGGYTSRAYLHGAVFTRESVKRVQQTQINQMVDRLERELLASSSSEVGAALTPDEAKVQFEQGKQKAQFIAGLRKVEAAGRMVVSLDDIQKFRNSDEDFELEDNDSIYVPPNPESIQVIGAVYNQSAYLYKPDKDFSYYIGMSGGLTKSAEEKEIYILKVNGRATKPKQGSLFWSPSSHRWSSGYVKLEPGDTIVVPEELDKVAWLRDIKDITQIMFQIATSAGVFLVAF